MASVRRLYAGEPVGRQGLRSRRQRPGIVKHTKDVIVMHTKDVFVILRWPADAGFPRYSFATVPHANEIQMAVERIQTCSSIGAAAAIIARLNAEAGAA
jgi:hypothetical protein